MVVSLEVVYRIDRFELLQLFSSQHTTKPGFRHSCAVTITYNRRAHVAIARFGALAGSTYGATVR